MRFQFIAGLPVEAVGVVEHDYAALGVGEEVAGVYELDVGADQGPAGAEHEFVAADGPVDQLLELVAEEVHVRAQVGAPDEPARDVAPMGLGLEWGGGTERTRGSVPQGLTPPGY